MPFSKGVPKSVSGIKQFRYKKAIAFSLLPVKLVFANASAKPS